MLKRFLTILALAMTFAAVSGLAQPDGPLPDPCFCDGGGPVR
jgi:hypothetical protein